MLLLRGILDEVVGADDAPGVSLVIVGGGERGRM
jgi:hypothetical protein